MYERRSNFSLSARSGHERQLDEARLTGRVIDALRGLPVIARLGPEDVRDEGLRVSGVEREPTRLYLQHDAVPRQEDVVAGGGRKAVERRQVRLDWLRSLKALAVAPAEDVRGDHQLVAADVRL